MRKGHNLRLFPVIFVKDKRHTDTGGTYIKSKYKSWIVHDFLFNIGLFSRIVNILSSFFVYLQKWLNMPTVNIEDKLYEEIREYCRLNKLTISVFVNDLLKKNFMVEKYDDAPPFFKKKEPDIESIPVDVKKIAEEKTPEEFKQEYLAEPEPIKKKEYVKPEVISVETKKDEKALTEREKARKRVQYL